MKNSFFALITIICMFSSLFVSHAGQAPSSLYHHPKTFETVDLNDEITIEYTLTEFNSHTRSNTKTAGKKATFKANGKIVATIYLTATFTYNGSSATCTSASSTYSMSDGWSYSSRTTTRSGRTASTSAKISKNNEYFHANVTITCSNSGAIS